MPELQELLEDAGYTVTYLPDPVHGGGWFADIRWANGHLAQTGNAATREGALRGAIARLARNPLNMPPGPARIAMKAIYDAGFADGQRSR